MISNPNTDYILNLSSWYFVPKWNNLNKKEFTKKNKKEYIPRRKWNKPRIREIKKRKKRACINDCGQIMHEILMRFRSLISLRAQARKIYERDLNCSCLFITPLRNDKIRSKWKERIYEYIRTYIYAYTYNTCTHRTQTHTHIHTYCDTHTHTHSGEHIHTHTYRFTHISKQASACVFVYVTVWMYMYQDMPTKWKIRVQ